MCTRYYAWGSGEFPAGRHCESPRMRLRSPDLPCRHASLYRNCHVFIILLQILFIVYQSPFYPPYLLNGMELSDHGSLCKNHSSAVAGCRQCTVQCVRHQYKSCRTGGGRHSLSFGVAACEASIHVHVLLEGSRGAVASDVDVHARVHVCRCACHARVHVWLPANEYWTSPLLSKCAVTILAPDICGKRQETGMTWQWAPQII